MATLPLPLLYEYTPPTEQYEHLDVNSYMYMYLHIASHRIALYPPLLATLGKG